MARPLGRWTHHPSGGPDYETQDHRHNMHHSSPYIPQPPPPPPPPPPPQQQQQQQPSAGLTPHQTYAAAAGLPAEHNTGYGGKPGYRSPYDAVSEMQQAASQLALRGSDPSALSLVPAGPPHAPIRLDGTISPTEAGVAVDRQDDLVEMARARSRMMSEHRAHYMTGSGRTNTTARFRQRRESASHEGGHKSSQHAADPDPLGKMLRGPPIPAPTPSSVPAPAPSRGAGHTYPSGPPGQPPPPPPPQQQQAPPSESSSARQQSGGGSQSDSRALRISNLLSDDGDAPESARASSKAPIQVPAASDEPRYVIKVRQQPVAARSCGFGERDRRVVDPPPIVQLHLEGDTSALTADEIRDRMAAPFAVVHCSIWNDAGDQDNTAMPEDYRSQRRLMGALVASPFVGLDDKGDEGCFFCFPDLSCRTPGSFRLRFSLVIVTPWQKEPGNRRPIEAVVMSDVFTVYNAKDFPGMQASTPLTKRLKEQGCLISIKKGNDKYKDTRGGGGGGGGASGSGGGGGVGKMESDEDDVDEDDDGGGFGGPSGGGYNRPGKRQRRG